MKKVLLCLLLFFIFGMGFISAQESTINFTEGIKNFSDRESIRERSNEALEKEVTIPENLQIAARVLFGINNETRFTLQNFILYICFWFIIFILFKEILAITPFFQGAKAWVVSLIIMLLIGISGGLLLIANFIDNLSTFFGALKEWSLLSLVLSILLIFALYVVIAKLLKVLKKNERVEGMKETGRNIKLLGEVGKIERENLRKE